MKKSSALQKKNPTDYKALFHEKSGSILLNIHEIRGAKEHLHKAEKHLLRSLNTSLLNNVYINLSVCYFRENNYKTSLAYELRALEIAKKNNDKQSIAHSYFNIGCSYEIQKNNTKAEEYFKKTLSLAQKIKFSSLSGDAYLNLGCLYLDNNKVRQSLPLLDSAYATYQRINDVEGSIYALTSLAFAYKELGSIDMARLHASKAHDLNLKRQHLRPQGYIYRLYGEIFESQNKIDSSEFYFQKSALIFQEMNDLEELKETYQSLSELYKSNHLFQKAFGALKKHSALSDTLEKINNTSVIQGLSEKYENKQKERVLNAQKNKISFRKKLLIFLCVFGASLLLLSFLLYRVLQKNILANRVLSEQKKILEKEQIHTMESIDYAKKICSSLLSKPIDQEPYFLLFNPSAPIHDSLYGYSKINKDFFIWFVSSTHKSVAAALQCISALDLIKKIVLEHSTLTTEEIKTLFYKKIKDEKNDSSIQLDLIKYNTVHKHVSFSLDQLKRSPITFQNNAPLKLHEQIVFYSSHLELPIEKIPKEFSEKKKFFKEQYPLPSSTALSNTTFIFIVQCSS